MMIATVLFDADGVVQYQTAGWRDAFEKVLGEGQSLRIDDFMRDVFAAEEPTLTGRGNFAEALAAVLKNWRCQGSLDDALRVWTMIDVYSDVIEAIQKLRNTGIRCCLATNQQSYRAMHMSRTLQYHALFDREFYSCEMGFKKPGREYFLRIIQSLELPAGRVLFLDDHEANVTAAKEVGLHAVKYEGKAGVPVLRQTLSAFGIDMS